MNPTILIAEDEPLMRERLQTMLAHAWPEACIVQVAENGNDAWDGFLEHEPSVVFLDIRMPGLSGLEVAERIGKRAHVVFVTAYDQYAVDAFDAGAVDYLLKPVQAERLQRALARLREKLGAQPADMANLLQSLRAALPAPPREKLKWIRASVGKQIRLINIDDVLFFQADDKYTCVHSAGREHLIRTPIAELAARLDPGQFWQVHRSTLVNLQHLESTRRDDASRLWLRLRGHPVELPVSRAFVHLFKAM